MTDSVRDAVPPTLPRRLTHRWPTLVGVGVVVATFVDGVPPVGILAGLLAVMPLCYLLFGAFRGEFHGSRVVAVQLAGLVGFTTMAALALAADETLGLRMVAAGWLAHGIWDIVHHRSGRIVPQAWSEWCAVVDVGGAFGILAFA